MSFEAFLEQDLSGDVEFGRVIGNQHKFLTDAEGVMTRNPYRPGDVIPDNDSAPVAVRMSFDMAITTNDATGHAVLTQSVLGVEASGVATADDGVLAIETVATIEMDLLGIGRATSVFNLELVTSDSQSVAADTTPPVVLETSADPVSGDVEVLFDEPIDITTVDSVQVSDLFGAVDAHFLVRGAALIVRPLLATTGTINLTVGGLTDLSGNAYAGSSTVDIPKPEFADTDTPGTIDLALPGVPCALADQQTTTPGRCAGGNGSDDLLSPFSIAADEPLRFAFTQPFSGVVYGDSCGSGSVRLERVGSFNDCTEVVPGSLITTDRTLTFWPDRPLDPSAQYRWIMQTGGGDGCDQNELCSLLTGSTFSFDPLADVFDAGGPDLVVPFSVVPPARRRSITVCRPC